MGNKVNISNSRFSISNSSNVNIGVIKTERKETFEMLQKILHNAKSLSSEKCLGKNKKVSLVQNIRQLENYLDSDDTSISAISESLKSIRNIAEGTIGSTISTWLISTIGKLL